MLRSTLWWRVMTFVMIGAASPLAAAQDGYVDPLGRNVPFETTYESWFGDDRYERRYGRALGENSILLGFELFLYWYNPNESVADWQFPDLQSKLEDNALLRFDDNMHRTNMLLHPFAGSTHYVFTRVSGFGVLASFGAAATSSALYEVWFEWREIISINDLIVTPFAGMAMGEFFNQLGEYLNSRPRRPRTLDGVVGRATLGRQVGAGLLGLPRALHGFSNEARPPMDVADDALGLSSAYWHAFHLSAGPELIANDEGSHGSVLVVNAGAKIFAMPGFLRPGKFAKAYHGGNYAAMRARLSTNSRVRDFDIEFETHPVGRYAQDFEQRPEGLSGHAYEIGGQTRLRYVDRWLFDRRDHHATLELFGPKATYWLAAGATRLRLSASVAPHVSQIRSLAYPAWVADLGDEGTKSSLIRHGYYNAAGVTARANAELSASGAILGVEARYGRYESIDGLERFRQDVTREPHMRDDVAEFEVSAGYDPPDTIMSTRVAMAHVERRSRMPPFEHSRHDQRLGVTLGVLF